MPPNNPMTEGEALAVDVRQELDRKFLDVWQDSTDYYAMSKAGAKFIWDSAVRAALSAASEGAAIAPEEVHVRIAGRYVLCDLQETTFDDLALYHARESAADTAASGGEVVAWVEIGQFCLGSPEEWNLQSKQLEAEDQPLYTAPPAAVPADALERLVRTWEAEGIRLNGGADKPYTNEENSVRAFVLGCCAGDLAALIPKGADHA